MNRGILFILISTAGFAVVNAFVKLIDRIPISEIVFFRSAITLTMSIWLVRKNKLPFFGNNHFWLLVRGVFGASALILFFYTLKTLPIATATTVQYLSQVFTVIIAVFLVGEFVRPIRWIFFLIAFAGVFIMEGFQENPNWTFLSIGVLSALFSGIAYNAIIKCKNTDHPYTIVMAFPLVATPVTGIWAATEWVTPSGMEWVYLLVIGLFTQLAQVFMTMSLHAEKAAIVTPFKYLGAVYALVIGLLFFDEVLTIQSVSGMLLVISAVVANAFIK
jgi:drug/metabolite transporter (DMT)-like permease